MRLPTAALVASAVVLCTWGVLRAQKPFREWPAIEYEDFALPDDYQQKAEWTRARLRYPDIYGYPNRHLFYEGGREFPGYWTMDYPRSDRHLLQGVRRLTRIDSRSVEQVVTLDGTDEVYNWPMLYAVEVGHWDLSDDVAAQLREFLLRGGFLMVDDFHGSDAADHDVEPGALPPWNRGINEWGNFTASIERVFPNRRIEDLPNADQIFHTVYDLDDRFQVPGWQWHDTGLTYEKGPTGKVPHWRGIRDDNGRVMVAICHNMDLGDAWEWSDDPRYPEKWASLAYRIAMNYFIYDLTH
jgi:hypothetical protein